jgi:hypothetical protein
VEENMRRMEYRALAAALCVAQGAIWLAIQPGFPLMGDITGVDDGSLEQGLAILIPAAILGWRFAVGRGSWGFLAWNAVWAVLWAIYSIHHLGRWAVYGEGNVVLLVPELVPRPARAGPRFVPCCPAYPYRGAWARIRDCCHATTPGLHCRAD